MQSRILFLLLFLFLVSEDMFSQSPGEHERVLDTPPMEMISAPTRTLLPGVITTPDGYDNFDLGVDNAEPHMSSNPLNALWHFNAFNTNRAHYTTDGHDWTFQAPVFGSGFSMRGDPVTAYDSLGNLYYENMYSATSTSSIIGCKVMVSTDNGATWSPSLTAIAGVDKNWIACDQTKGPYANYVYTVMTASSGGNFARSTDFGATWTTTFSPTVQNLPGMMVAVGPNVLGGNNISGGCVYVVTNSGSTASSVYTFYRSTDGGATFDPAMSSLTVAGYVGTLNTQGRLVINNARTRPYPFIAADNSYGPFRGRLYLVYAANDPPGNGNKPDIFLQYSDDQAVTWSARVRVNDNLNPTSTNEWFPAIWCDKATGRLYIKWYDMRNDPTNIRAWVYGTFTDDGGATFAPNQKISNSDFVFPAPACSPNTNCYRGDYDAIASNDVTSISVWTDFRNGNYGSFTGYFPDFAMQLSQTAVDVPATGSANIRIRVPSVKLYTNVARFSVTVTPASPMTFEFPQGDSLTSYPDSLLMVVQPNGAANGTYAVVITGAGPNGTPVHRRSLAVTVRGSLALSSPNGGDAFHVGDSTAIQWSSTSVTGNLVLLLSRNGGQTYPETLFTNTADDGNQIWHIGGPTTANARIRIVSIADPLVSDTTDQFMIYDSRVSTGPGWNLVSVPVAVSDPRKSTLFPSSTSPAFIYTGAGYQARDTMLIGNGYWLKFPGTALLPITGTPVTSVTISVPQGWSLLGSVSFEIPVDSLVQSPPGFVSNFYAYIPGVGYQSSPATLSPGQSLWLKASQPGQITIRANSAIPLLRESSFEGMVEQE